MRALVYVGTRARVCVKGSFRFASNNKNLSRPPYRFLHPLSYKTTLCTNRSLGVHVWAPHLDKVKRTAFSHNSVHLQSHSLYLYVYHNHPIFRCAEIYYAANRSTIFSFSYLPCVEFHKMFAILFAWQSLIYINSFIFSKVSSSPLIFLQLYFYYFFLTLITRKLYTSLPTNALLSSSEFITLLKWPLFWSAGWHQTLSTVSVNTILNVESKP